MNQKTLLKGTFFLILAGFITRFIGFFYRIFLSNILGAKNLGIYQLIFPIYGICFTIYASGIQTGISKIVSSLLCKKNNKQQIFSPFFTGSIISLILSLILSLSLFRASSFIAINLLHEPDCTYPLQILSLVFPFCGFTSCINGFYYALKQTAIPSLTQLVEQVIRVGVVFVFSTFSIVYNHSCELAVIGLVLGEMASCIFIIIALFFNKDFKSTIFSISKSPKRTIRYYLYPFRDFLSYTTPLTLNKLLINILGSLESMLIPFTLMKYGFSHNNALSTYGILTGMAMSFISFPSTITNSLSVILLPTISEADSIGDSKSIKRTIEQTLHYSLIIGIFSLFIFILFGRDLGSSIFNNPTAGTFITILAWLCPFLYVTTTFSSILNGLGKSSVTFRNSLLSVCIRLVFVIFIIPKLGIIGYLLGILISSIGICILDYFSLKKYINFNINAYNSIIKPAVTILLTGFTFKFLYNFILTTFICSNILVLFSTCFILLVLYILILYWLNIISIPKSY